MIPFVEVSHLASSTSFYSGVLQPLGLHYHPPPEVRGLSSSPLPTLVTYCINGGDPVLELRQTANPLRPPVLTSLVISAPSQQSVSIFHRCGARADPPLWSRFRDRRGLENHFKDVEEARKGPWQTTDRNRVQHTHAVLYDLDGNRIEVVHSQEYGNEGPPPTVLDWKFDVEKSSQAAPKPTRITLNPRKVNGANPGGDIHRSTAITHTRHTETVYGPHSAYRPAHSGALTKVPPPTVAETMPRDPAQRGEAPQEGGFNSTTMMGALLGVAAAGALTYGIVQSRRSPSPDAPDQRYLDGPPRRRATFPDKPVTSYRRQSTHETGVVPMYNYHDHKTPRKFAYPDFNSLPIRNAYVEGDEDVEYGNDPWSSAPQYLTRPPMQNGYPRSRVPSGPRVVEEIQDTRSRYSSRPQGQVPITRARSEAPARSQVEHYDRSYPPQRSIAPESTLPPRANGLKVRRAPVPEFERETYVSARTHRSSRIDPQPDRGRPDDEPRSRSRARSRARSRPRSRTRSRARTQVSAVTARPPPTRTAYSTAPSRISARRIPLPKSGAGSSQVGWEARDIPLPMSGVGSSHADWDDDMESLAPSDSISCIGSKSSRRARKYRH